MLWRFLRSLRVALDRGPGWDRCYHSGCSIRPRGIWRYPVRPQSAPRRHVGEGRGVDHTGIYIDVTIQAGRHSRLSRRTHESADACTHRIQTGIRVHVTRCADLQLSEPIIRKRSRQPECRAPGSLVARIVRSFHLEKIHSHPPRRWGVGARTPPGRFAAKKQDFGGARPHG